MSATITSSLWAGAGHETVADLVAAVMGAAADQVSGRLLELAASGVTELMADVFGSPEERAATAGLLTRVGRAD